MSEPITLASWNVNSLNVRKDQVLDLLRETGWDVLALQETKMTDAAFPASDFERLGYGVRFTGERTYNGVAVLFRKDRFEEVRPEDVLLEMPGRTDPQRRFLALTLRPKGGEAFRVVDVYVPNGSAPGSRKFLHKMDWLSDLQIAVAKMLETTPRLIVAGDFNIAPEDADVWDPAVWRGNLLVSAPERRALRRLMTLGFSDAYRIFPQAPKTYSWWDYRSRGYEKNEGLRIDLTLVSDALRPDVTAAAIVEGPRALPQPSDHAPVTVTFR